jgi:hypothetical protein
MTYSESIVAAGRFMSKAVGFSALQCSFLLPGSARASRLGAHSGLAALENDSFGLLKPRATSFHSS